MAQADDLEHQVADRLTRSLGATRIEYRDGQLVVPDDLSDDEMVAFVGAVAGAMVDVTMLLAAEVDRLRHHRFS